MVALPATHDTLSPEAYLAAEVHSPTKHEYRDGEVYAMAGGTDAHVTIALNLWALLRGHLRKQGCRAYALDMKARIETLNRFCYPDVMVTCDLETRKHPPTSAFPNSSLRCCQTRPKPLIGGISLATTATSIACKNMC